MKLFFTSLLVVVLFLTSCEGRTGYLDRDQELTVSTLTGAEWLMTYADYGNGHEYTFDQETQIYRFEATGKGWLANGSFDDELMKENVSYYQWTFTTDNFTVIYMAGSVVEGYMLIEKLNSNELWVQSTQLDPVFYPNQHKTYYRFKSRKNLR